jgi:hypothetical protein
VTLGRRIYARPRTAGCLHVGKFNPAIFSPAWLAKMGLISDAAFEAATIGIIHPDIARFAADDISYDVLPTRAQLQSESEPFVRTSDTVATIFGKLLPHTPIWQLGINLEAHFKTLTLDQRIHLGRALAPLEPWGSFGRRIQEETGARRGGMVAVAMQESTPKDRKAGHRLVRVEPSSKNTEETGVAVFINDHFEYPHDTLEVGAAEIVSILQDRFDDSLAEGRKIAGELMKYALDLAK